MIPATRRSKYFAVYDKFGYLARSKAHQKNLLHIKPKEESVETMQMSWWLRTKDPLSTYEKNANFQSIRAGEGISQNTIFHTDVPFF